MGGARRGRDPPDTVARGTYFPERTLARWLELHGMPSTVYALERTGVEPLRAAYRALIEHVGGVDAIVPADGGTDILMRGDENGLGTPEEDMASLGTVHGLTGVAERLVVCLGFGVDAYHGVNQALVLENLAAPEQDGACLGAFSRCRATAEKERSTWTRSPTRRPRRPTTRASSTAPWRPPCGAGSGTSASPNAPGTASCSSIR